MKSPASPNPLTQFRLVAATKSKPLLIDREINGRWIAEHPDLPGVMAYGSTQEEAVTRCYDLALRAQGIEIIIYKPAPDRSTT
jgi:hypothetical protein